MELLAHDSRVVNAARVARVFHLDPVSVLQDDGDEFLMLVRLAALDVVNRDRKAEAEAERRAAKSGGRG